MESHRPDDPRLEPNPVLRPFLKWPGGKRQELPAIAAAAPALTSRLIDPFVGGGTILLATPAEVPALANDACRDLVEVYHSSARRDIAFEQAVEGVAATWQGMAWLGPLYVELAEAFRAGGPEGADREVVRARLQGHASRLRSVVDQAGPGLATSVARRIEADVLAKLERMRRLQIRRGQELPDDDLLANVEGSLRSSLYVAVRGRYNVARQAGRWDEIRAADFLFLRELAYAAMFRFNRRDEFNVPYGGISYNRKSLADKAQLMFGNGMRARLANSRFESRDFEPFLAEADPMASDFVFVDPPYDSDFSAYDNRPFEGGDQARLARVLAALPARVMVVIKDAPAIRALYSPDRWLLTATPKTYMWTIKSRNDRLATHLMITNYEPEPRRP
jgi:DNA adenine methylase